VGCEGVTVDETGALVLCWGGAELMDVAVVLVLLEDDREKLKLLLDARVRRDCSDMRELDLCRTRLSYDFLL
jgi:hypothetical protein